ncbi:hypothetical protein G7046_g9435 [Stylonectria norvegica]|nr:hypothetical protein G7046_g9435 [Stylonectria norvegica]
MQTSTPKSSSSSSSPSPLPLSHSPIVHKMNLYFLSQNPIAALCCAAGPSPEALFTVPPRRTSSHYPMGLVGLGLERLAVEFMHVAGLFQNTQGKRGAPGDELGNGLPWLATQHISPLPSKVHQEVSNKPSYAFISTCWRFAKLDIGICPSKSAKKAVGFMRIPVALLLVVSFGGQAGLGFISPVPKFLSPRSGRGSLRSLNRRPTSLLANLLSPCPAKRRKKSPSASSRPMRPQTATQIS